ncbi:MAG: MarR family transcriptional regulator [Marinobacter sp.]|uniref:MarR family winged helix-turn-helix transcriptional regulator n=1 Tax=Marinobacter sp. TaxID=50741 RepID=UPI001B7CA645|nr:MarR family transcriptional regulator [Marinobacter sp.]MBQ0748477.1 MarR family transcriptional regulator [Marinobacter sp.]MBQ0815780.1 MarR family transcriptional regulator [Marinobacter sp.]|tara:strand:- start:1186 stop:1635 length:450 start_codon:yes stop_codon:yes gene_type:complete
MTKDTLCSELLLDNQLCFALHSTSLMMTKTYKPLLKALNLTYPQYLAMLVLWEEDGITVSHISKRLLTDPGSLSPLLKRLEADGLLTRKRRAVDERVVELHLTDKGRRLRDQAQTVPGCIINASGQSMPDLAELKRQLLKLRENLKTLT